MISSVAADALDEDTLLRQQRFRLPARLADRRPILLHAIGAQVELMPGRAGLPLAFLPPRSSS